MRPLLTLLACAPLAVGVGACGSARKSTLTTRKALPLTTPSNGAPVATPLSAGRVSAGHAAGSYLNDGDHDRIGDEDGDNNGDVDNDAPWDYKKERNDNRDYHDRDDSVTLSFGRPADAATRRAVTALVKRYYAAAAAGDGRAACSMLLPSLAKAMPIDYGSSPAAPAYLRGHRTCRSIMRSLFEGSRSALSAPVSVTGVRLNASDAYAFVGSATMPASYLTMHRQHGSWAVTALLGETLR